MNSFEQILVESCAVGSIEVEVEVDSVGLLEVDVDDVGLVADEPTPQQCRGTLRPPAAE
jgi:hypothetical protein